MVIRVMSGHADSLRGLAVSSEGATLATASFDGTIGLWDLLYSRERVTLAHGGKVHAVAYSPHAVPVSKYEPAESVTAK
ncbi:MAG: hypothetical protein K8T89_26130 [Planctomycetes bacterium]|nr:hypothetical protein [Planctomycetota bacterium]